MPNRKYIRVLVVDDDEEDYMFVRDYLSEITLRKYDVDWVPSFEQGLAGIHRSQHDVYLIDYRLGAENGLELIHQVQQEGILVPVILLTGQGQQAIDERALDLGVADYLIKDQINASVLDRSIRYSLQHFQMLQEVRRLHEQSEILVEERTAELAATVQQLAETNRSLRKHIHERQLAEQALSESRNLLATMAHYFPDGTISVIDEQWRYIFIDGQALGSIGLTAQALMGSDIRTRVQQEQLQVMEPAIQAAFKGSSGQFEIMHYHRCFVCYVVPLPDIKQEIKRVMIVSQDITKRRIAEEETHKALEKERQLGELKSRFVSMASHEFRTPLATILSSSALIARYENQEDADKRSKHIQRIQSSVRHLTATLNDFLSLSKIEEGVTTNNPVACDIVELCEDTREEMQITAKEGQHIAYHHEGDGNCMNLDRQLLHNIMVNLLSNAMKYSPEHSTIYFESKIDGDGLNIQVQDSGIGIPAEDQPHIFSTFFRAQNASNIQGTGLGLHIVKRYADLMGGRIQFVSEQDKGTTFSLILPDV